MLTAGIIIIGDEILNGNIVDANSVFLCQRFHAIGIHTRRVSTVPDDVEMIAEDVKTFSNLYDFVITTGGVGLGHNDVTYAALSVAFRTTLRPYKELEKFYGFCTNKDEICSSVKSITVPSIAEILMVDLEVPLVGSFTKFPVVKTKNVFCFPGTPSYTKTIFLAMEKKHFQNSELSFFSRVIYLNVEEKDVSPMLNDCIAEFQDKVQFGSYPLIDFPKKNGEMIKIYVESTSLYDCLEAERTLLLKFPSQWHVPIKSKGPNFEIIRRLMVTNIELAVSLKTSYQQNFLELFLTWVNSESAHSMQPKMKHPNVDNIFTWKRKCLKDVLNFLLPAPVSAKW